VEWRVAIVEIATYEQQWKANKRSDNEYAKCERTCRKQHEIQRQVADLTVGE
jgi:hypothetical protein